MRLVFKAIAEKEDGKEAINPKKVNSSELMNYFREVLPEFDEERVYTSNIKKVMQWYNILAAKNFDFASISEEEETEEA